MLMKDKIVGGPSMSSAIIGLSILSAWLPACGRPVLTAAGDAAPIDSSRAFLKLSDIRPAPSLPPAEPARKSEPVEAAQRYLRQARERFDEQLWADAISALEKSLQLDPDCAEARVLLARAAMRQGNTSLAESHLKEV